MTKKLILSRKVLQSVVVDGPCEITVLRAGGGRISLLFRAPKDVKVIRTELLKEEAKGE